MVNLVTSIRVMFIPLRASRLSLLGYLIEIYFDGWSYLRSADHEAPTPRLFSVERSKRSTSLNVFRVKSSLLHLK